MAVGAAVLRQSRRVRRVRRGLMATVPDADPSFIMNFRSGRLESGREGLVRRSEDLRPQQRGLLQVRVQHFWQSLRAVDKSFNSFYDFGIT
jgi:hypothetical protein